MNPMLTELLKFTQAAYPTLDKLLSDIRGRNDFKYLAGKTVRVDVWSPLFPIAEPHVDELYAGYVASALLEHFQTMGPLTNQLAVESAIREYLNGLLIRQFGNQLPMAKQLVATSLFIEALPGGSVITLQQMLMDVSI